MQRPLLVVDLEATCDERGFPRDQMEIIEIGAVLVDAEHLQPLDEFQTFVRPVMRPYLTRFCTQLTSIQQSDVDDAPTFAEVLPRWTAWMPGPVRLASWGAYDKHQLELDASRHSVTLPFADDHLDIKRAFARRMKLRRPVGMKRALELVGLPLEGTHHRGIDDARNIVRLLPWVA